MAPVLRVYYMKYKTYLVTTYNLVIFNNCEHHWGHQCGFFLLLTIFRIRQESEEYNRGEAVTAPWYHTVCVCISC